MRVLCLPTDCFGGRGGIALHCRHLLAALAADRRVEKLRAIPRVLPEHDCTIPPGIEYPCDRPETRAGYIRTVLRHGLFAPKWHVVVTEHIHLLPLAALIAGLHRSRLCLVVHGFEAWQRPAKYPYLFIKPALARLDTVIAVSRVTRDRFVQWSGVERSRVRVIANAIEPGMLAPGPRPRHLGQRYGIGDEPVIITVGRLAAAERAKGFDQVIRVMPALLESKPDLKYLVVGEGDDRERLERLCDELGLAASVIFAGHIDDSEKPDHYRLGDAFIMPSRLEGFGYVFLEAMACGLPVVGSRLDGGSEPLMDGRLGRLVDPDDPEELTGAILAALDSEKSVPGELERFSLPRFEQEVRETFLQ
jgi:glycosyltransferase involved in cell wall biosynthesis